MFLQNAGNTVYLNTVPVSKNKISNNKYCFTVAIITHFHTQKFHIILLYLNSHNTDWQKLLLQGTALTAKKYQVIMYIQKHVSAQEYYLI
jgi:hypothetical protein